MRLREMEKEKEFRLKAYAVSRGESTRMSEVTPQKFEYGQNVVDTRIGRQGQVRLIVWDPKLEGWRYCIARKDLDELERYIDESDLAKAPAQTRIDETGKTIIYAPRRLKQRQRRPTRTRIDESWLSKRLIE